MNLIKPIKNLPNWKWKENSQNEIDINGKELVAESDFIYRVGKVVVLGFIYHSFLNPPWMWFVLADKVTIADLIDFRRLEKMIPKGTLTAVALDFKVGMRFAKLYNFVETEEELDYKSRVYKVMRKV